MSKKPKSKSLSRGSSTLAEFHEELKEKGLYEEMLENVSERFVERVNQAGLRGLVFNEVWSG